MKKFILLAELLFQMENESIGNDTKIHFELNGWLDKFGERSVKFESELTSTNKDHKELAKLIKSDFDKGEWTPNEDGSLYNYLMPTFYGGFITEVYERQLANLTGIGTQLSISL